MIQVTGANRVEKEAIKTRKFSDPSGHVICVVARFYFSDGCTDIMLESNDYSLDRQGLVGQH